MQNRVGIGSDLHRLADGDGLWLGGVLVACEFSSVAHSDGDALLHALTDALLGAIGAGDIGELFPDTLVENKGRASANFVREAVRIATLRGYRPGNIDAIIHLQRPKLSPYKDAIRRKIAEFCGIAVDCVNVKAKTGEELGPVGESKAVAAEVVVLLLPVENGDVECAR